MTALSAAALEFLETDTPDTIETAPESMRGMLEPGKRKDYILAGIATITVRSPSTGNRYTFKISQSKPEPGRFPVWFVGVLNGPDNTDSYAYLGTIFPDGFRITKKSRISPDAPSAVAFAWLARGRWEDPRVEVWHEGTCGKCGRKLTVPESIASGIGPTCAQKAA